MTTELARTDSRQSLLAKMSQQYSLDPKVFLDTIQKTVFSGAKNQEQVIALLMVLVVALMTFVFLARI